MANGNPEKEFSVDNLNVQIYPDRETMGSAAAHGVAGKIRALMMKQEGVRIIFASAPSQDDILRTLSEIPDIDWQRVTAFHMDEYIGLPAGAPQGFGFYLKTRLFDKVPVKKIHYIDQTPSDIQTECRRYASLLSESPIDILCLGIGENGHIAFNDPHVADFNDPEAVKVVELDEICRRQQVNDGCFVTIDEVPKRAITLTIPTLLSADFISVVVPGPTKTQAVYNTLKGAIDTSCPASVLRRHKQCMLFLDGDSAAKV